MKESRSFSSCSISCISLDRACSLRKRSATGIGFPARHDKGSLNCSPGMLCDSSTAGAAAAVLGAMNGVKDAWRAETGVARRSCTSRTRKSRQSPTWLFHAIVRTSKMSMARSQVFLQVGRVVEYSSHRHVSADVKTNVLNPYNNTTYRSSLQFHIAGKRIMYIVGCLDFLVPRAWWWSLSVFCLFLQSNAGSFYDNPEQDPLPSGADAGGELHRKWDHEVGQGLLVLLYSRMSINIPTSVGIFRYLNLCPSETCQVFEQSGRSVRHRNHRSAV